ncbi:hypothetical protein I302_102027 [Kwoniella bestiolae CBS 10118]|uniref:Uncharacterized protein n=1 Tax=Kwoniella bestiolae CBS 10118 TaxID=1296100 RepID=A0A1B9GE06_9TREE|nr:hypothetical protein I302_00711 [Kwoniella bestiolae CBS 10118]OCF29215.1 hypothetical protein I302_00711 [Kwoniella bestiolae CBS 10118]
MKATYFAAIFLSATFSLAAPAGLNDIIPSQNTISPLGNANSKAPSPAPGLPLNQIGSILTPPPSTGKPEEYISGALKSHKPSKRAIDLPLHDASKSKTKYQSGNDGLIDTVENKLNVNDSGNGKSKTNDDKLKGVSDTLSKVGGIKNMKKRMDKRESEDMAVDHLGRKVVRRGNDFQIQEVQDQGRQWGGASELSDENDEPVYGL